MPDKGQYAAELEKIFPGRPGVAAAAEKLFDFSREVEKWNRSVNLTGKTGPREFFFRHLCDSLTALRMEGAPETGRIADLGSGAGLPGIPLALALPGLEVYSVDKSLKKIAFQRNVKRKLGIKNFYPVHSPLEDFRPEAPLDGIFSRALAKTDFLLGAAEPLLSENGRCLFWKGPTFREEWERVRPERKSKFRLLEAREFSIGHPPFRSTLALFARENRP